MPEIPGRIKDILSSTGEFKASLGYKRLCQKREEEKEEMGKWERVIDIHHSFVSVEMVPLHCCPSWPRFHYLTQVVFTRSNPPVS